MHDDYYNLTVKRRSMHNLKASMMKNATTKARQAKSLQARKGSA